MQYNLPILSRRLVCTAVGLASMAAAYAIPAHPGTMKIPQPDGTAVEVVLKGDESRHAWFTPDGYPLLRVGDAFYYANVGTDGALTTTGIRLTAANSPAERAHRAVLNPAQAVKAMNAARQAAPAFQRRLPGLYPGASFPLTGEQRSLVILVEYQDVKMTMPNALDYFTRMLNEPGFSDYDGTGSARDYYLESSGGKFDCRFDVYGPVKLSQNRVYYGGNDPYTGQDMRPEQMVIEACRQLDATVDFSQYDRDGDGWIDNVFVFYAGQGESSGAAAETVWPHSFNVITRNPEPYVFDGVRLNRYACSYEWEGSRPDGVGTFIHEFGHVLGLPDIYTTAYGESFTPGPWCCMDRGPYNNNGHTPPYFSAYERAACGWLEPLKLDRAMSVTLPPISANAAAMVQTARENEYFLFENRQQEGWDKYIPGHGMLVWHIDYDAEKWKTNVANNTPDHQCIDIEEADGLANEATRAGDAFPGTLRIDEFGDDTKPGMRAWNGKRQYTPITNIREVNGLITFDVRGGARLDAPALTAETDAAGLTARLQWSRVTVEPIEEGEPYAPSHYLLSVYQSGTDNSRSFLEGYERRNVGDVDSLTLELPAGEYYCSVQAAYGLQIGDESAPVRLGTANGIAETTADLGISVRGRDIVVQGCRPGCTVTAHDLAGRTADAVRTDSFGAATLAADAPGVYLVTDGRRTAKVVIRQ